MCARYVEYRLWSRGPLLYRRRVLLRKANDLQEEVVGFNFFELNDARLFRLPCDWSIIRPEVGPAAVGEVGAARPGWQGALCDPRWTQAGVDAAQPGLAFHGGSDALILLCRSVQNGATGLRVDRD